MINNTINNDRTIAGGGIGTMLAGRHHIVLGVGQDWHGVGLVG